jgi:multiple sugar transport system permease protein
MTTAVQRRRFELPSRAVLREWLQGYLFASPFIIGFLVFIAFPMVYSIWLGFQRWNLLGDPQFVGFRNYIRVFTDERALLSLYNSAFYTLFAVPFQLVISFSLALALTQKLRFRDVYRSGFYLPIIIPLVAWSVVWQRIFHPEFGILNEVLGWIGIPPQPWLFDPALAKPAFIFMSFWMIGRQMVIFIAGLGNIPPSLMEAAKLDGAGAWRRLRHIVIPLMSPLILFNAIMAIINSFQTFIPAKIMTEGGPENSTLFAVLNIYNQGFKFFNMGYAAALAWQFFVIVIAITIFQFYMSKRWVYYED